MSEWVRKGEGGRDVPAGAGELLSGEGARDGRKGSATWSRSKRRRGRRGRERLRGWLRVAVA